MNSVGIDVSKGKSVIAIMRPGGEVVKAPFECKHTTRELEQLKEELSKLEGETKSSWNIQAITTSKLQSISMTVKCSFP